MIQFLTVFIIAVLVVIDQLIKLAVLKYLEPIGSLTVIPKVIQLSYLENTGAAFGSFGKYTAVLSVFTAVILAALIIFLLSKRLKFGVAYSAITLIVSGGLGNLIDRIITVYVRDFIHVIIKINGKEIFPFVFNIADIALVVGAIMLIIYILFISDEALFRHKKDKDEIKVTGNTDKADSSAEPAEEK